jgi:hypothetical protein
VVDRDETDISYPEILARKREAFREAATAAEEIRGHQFSRGAHQVSVVFSLL